MQQVLQEQSAEAAELAAANVKFSHSQSKLLM